MSRTTFERTQPNDQDVELAKSALERVKRYLAQHRGDEHEPVRVMVEEEASGGVREPLALPRVVVDLMARVLAHMAAGQSVSIVPSNAELTTQQAADLLNVSRPYLIGLLEEGEIEYRLVGTHRRIVAASLLEYRRQDDASRRLAADELVAQTQEMGLG
jgi:excisionase family DNA binding protein